MTSLDCIREGSGTGRSAPKRLCAWQVDANHLYICWNEGLLQSKKLSHGVWLCGTLHCAYLPRYKRNRYDVIYDHILLWPDERFLIDSPSPTPWLFVESMIICTSPSSCQAWAVDPAGQTDMHHSGQAFCSAWQHAVKSKVRFQQVTPWEGSPKWVENIQWEFSQTQEFPKLQRKLLFMKTPRRSLTSLILRNKLQKMNESNKRLTKLIKLTIFLQAREN